MGVCVHIQKYGIMKFSRKSTGSLSDVNYGVSTMIVGLLSRGNLPVTMPQLHFEAYNYCLVFMKCNLAKLTL